MLIAVGLPRTLLPTTLTTRLVPLSWIPAPLLPSTSTALMLTCWPDTSNPEPAASRLHPPENETLVTGAAIVTLVRVAEPKSWASVK